MSPEAKLIAITNKIYEKQVEAANASVQWSAAITKAIGEVLAAEGDPRSAQQFAADNGFDRSNPPQPQSKDTIRGFVEPMLKSDQTGPAKTPPTSSSNPVGATGAELPRVPGAKASTEGSIAPTAGEAPAGFVATPASNAAQKIEISRAQAIPGMTTTAEVPTPSPPPGTLPGTPAAGVPAVAGPGHSFSASIEHTGGLPSLPTTGMSAGLPDLGNTIAPENLAQGFNQGLQSGAPIATGTEGLSQAISQGAQNAVHPQVFSHPEFSTPTGNLSVATTPSSASMVESTYTPPPAPVAPVSPTVLGAPVAAPAAPTTSVPPPMAPVGPMPAYGADLRPATPTISALPPPMPSASAPTSAPVNPSSGGAMTQPAVVNKAPTPAAPTSNAPTGLTESALAATASGSAIGATSGQNAAKARLRRLLEAVARQEPRLHWAIGDREDGSTILVTDLACGWIPPHIEIPTGVELLTPAPRRAGMDALLRDMTLIEAWTPGHFLPEAKDVPPVPMSLRARDLPTIDDLNWEITQATNWRDGLPRLAHTLTKAAISGTGVLDSEADLLYEHLRAIGDKVFKTYPATIDAHAVGNWQLLAAIGALVSGHKTTLNYHFAWFQALHMAKQGGTS